MIMGVYSIKDKKIAFGTPIFLHSDVVAKRNFAIAVNNDELMRNAADDFELWKLGEWDDNRGLLVGHEPIYLLSGKDVVSDE